MMARRSPIALSLWLILGVAGGQAQESAEPPKANPFDRPDFVISLAAAAGPAVDATEPLEPVLRATLVANGSALANINGTILSTGQRYQGYRVIYIDEGRVVLSDGDERVVLNVYEQQQGSSQDGE